MTHHHDNYHLGTWGFPSTGFWVLHAIGIAAVFYYGHKVGRRNQDDCENYQ